MKTEEFTTFVKDAQYIFKEKLEYPEFEPFLFFVVCWPNYSLVIF